MKLNDNQKGVLAMVVMVVAAIVALMIVRWCPACM